VFAAVVEDFVGPAESESQDAKPPLPEYSDAIDERAVAYARELVRGVMEHLDEVDALIQGQAEHWRLERMVAVDRAILRPCASPSTNSCTNPMCRSS